MPSTAIAVKVKEDRAIVRIVIHHDDGKLDKYGLARNGEWIQVVDGQLYPDECILPVTFYGEVEDKPPIIELGKDAWARLRKAAGVKDA